MILGRPARQAFLSCTESTRLALVLLVCQPLVVKALLLLNVLKSDPRLKLSGLANPLYTGLPGATTIDPNIAYTSQALGTYAAKTLLNGGSLWWNPFEGVGMPLAGEMQSAALFPLTWLMILPNGQLIEHLLFQIIAAVATFLFVRRLGASVLASWFAGTAFCFNGTFAWLANAVINPICFLPVVLLGVELIRSAGRKERVVGGCCVSLGVAGSLYAGFPETAYLDALMIACWTVVRAAGMVSDRPRVAKFLLRTGTFAVAGTLLAAPLLFAFFDYLAIANVGIHSGTGTPGGPQAIHAAMLLVPYLLGGLSHGHGEFWGGIGGYAGIALFALAMAGVWGRSQRGIRWFLFAWSLVSLAVIYGFQPVTTLVNLLPGLRTVVVYRYIEPSLLFALATLASLALDDIVQDKSAPNRVRYALASVILLAIVLCGLAVAHGLRPAFKIEIAPIVMQMALIVVLALTVFVIRVDARLRAGLIAVISALEIVALFAVPFVSYPLKRDFGLGSVAFLQKNLGMQRFVATGPISQPGVLAANYGSYFEIAQVNWNDLPVPQTWVDYVRRHIDPQADAIVFRVSPAQFMKAVPAYALIGTRYATVPRAISLDPLKQVYVDTLVRIYEIPDARPYFSAPGCAVTARDRATVVTRCSQVSRLERLELFMPGWTATVDGRSTPVDQVGEIFQSVAVPAGVATTRFTFEPPGLRYGWLLAIGGIMLLIGALGVDWWAQRARTPEANLSV